MKIKLLNFVIGFIIVGMTTIQAQNLQGIIRDFDNDALVSNVEVSIQGLSGSVLTNDMGKFSIGFKDKIDGDITFTREGYQQLVKTFNVTNGIFDLGTIIMYATNGNQQSESDIDYGEVDIDTDTEDNTYSLLTASRDLFSNTAAYSFGTARFKKRGYGNKYNHISLNGATMNNLNDGNAYWSVWGGLNDVFRAKSDVSNIGMNDYNFGGIGGSQDVDLRASSQWKQTKASYAITNRSYRNRILVTHSTGMMSNGWAISLSGSKRWGNEGYAEGTFYDAYSYFMSVDKKIGDNHLLNLVVLGAPVKRGKGGASTQEAYDLAGTNYYNSNWGYQEGEKRNSRVVTAHQPIAILSHDWKINSTATLHTSAAIQAGKYGTSRLEWTDAQDPRPDYYKNLPSYQLTDENKDLVNDYLTNNPEQLQLDWNGFYQANYHVGASTIDDVGGVVGESYTGKNALYALGETHYDNQKLSIQSHLSKVLNQNSNLSVGAYYRGENVNNYVKLIDLLGADYYLDIDKFAQRDNGGDVDFFQSDLNHPNNVSFVDDIVKYNYDINTMKPGVWAQYDVKFNKVDAYIGADVNSTNFYREGLMKNGKFPERSFGKSEVQSFLGYSGKAGVTYKLNGRNYFTMNAAFVSEAIGARYAYSSPRTRDDLIKKLDNEEMQTIDLSYDGRFTGFKVKATAYFTKFKNQNYNRSLYLDGSTNSAFVNYIMTGIEKEHMGVEFAVEKSLGAGFSIKGVAAMGDYRITSRPDVYITYDSSPDNDNYTATAYLKNYYVPNTPQIAYNATLSYNSSKYWWANISFNYFDKMYLDFYPQRRTVEAVTGLNPNEDPELWNSILSQEKLDANYTVDMFVGKSWKIKDHFVNLNVGVNNLLNNTSFKTGGYEQTRFDAENRNVDKFPPKYFYAYGTNYYISLAVRI